MTNGTLPGYIPPHLQGQVDSFRNEPGGNISFRHDAAGLGGFGDAGGRKVISRAQYDATFDPKHRMTNWVDSVQNQYGGHKYPGNAAQNINDWIGGKLRRGLEWGMSSKGKSIGTAGLLSALAGGVGGTLLARRAEDEHPYRKGLLAALLLGVAGAGTSAFLQDREDKRQAARVKTAAVSDETAYLRAVILGESEFQAAEKASILKALAKMEDSEREKLAERAQALFGFGAGMFIARTLFSKGLLPPVIGGILGAAALTSNPRSKPKMNPWGQLSK